MKKGVSIQSLRDIIKKHFKRFYIQKIVSSIETQLVSFFLIYLLNPTEYGQLALIITVSQLMYVIATGWTDPTITNLGTKEYADTGSYRNIVVYRLIIVAVCFVFVSLLFLFAKYKVVSMIHGEEYFFITYLLFIAYALQSFFYQLLYPCNKNDLQSLFDVIYATLLLCLSLAIVRDIKMYVYVMLALNIGYAIVTLRYYFLYNAKRRLTLSREGFNKTLKFSIWQVLGVLGIYLTNMGVNYVYTIKQVDLQEIGLYNVAYKFFCEFTPIFAICVVVIPQWIFNQKDKVKLIINIKKYTIIGVVLLAVAYLVIFVLLKPFLILINKADYTASINYYLWLFPAFVFMSYSQITQLIIMTTPAYKHTQYSTLIQGFILLIFCFIFIGSYGVIGAIFSVTLSYLAKSLYLLYIYKRYGQKMILQNTSYE